MYDMPHKYKVTGFHILSNPVKELYTDNPTPSISAIKVSDYELSDYLLKPVGLWNVSLLCQIIEHSLYLLFIDKYHI